MSREQHPNEYCYHCRRHTQRRDHAVSCFWCKQPFETKPPEAAPRTFEAWWAENEVYGCLCKELCEKAWNDAKEAS